jgi:hypothetical protein
VTLNELAGSIADELKPWRGSLKQSQVLAEINDKIERLKNPTLSQLFSRLLGSGRKNREEAKRLRATLKKLEKQLAAIGHTFRITILPENQIGLWTPQRRTGGLHDELYDLLITSISSLDERKLAAAFAARLLMEKLSTEKPTVSNEGGSPFCTIASRLFEAVTGEPESNLVNACRRVNRLRSEQTQPE